jgi:hypothetical protein
MYQQPLHADKLTPGEKDDRKARFSTGTIDLFLISCPLRSEFSHFHSRKSCDTQEELVAYLQRIQDVIKDNLSDGELIDDPAEAVLDMLTVSLDWMLITVSPTWSHQRSLDTLIISQNQAVVFMMMGLSYLRSPAFTASGNAKTHELYRQLTEITKGTAVNDVYRALLAQTSDSPRYTFSRGLVQTSMLSSFVFAFLALLGKLFLGRNGLYLNISSRRKSRRQSFFRPSPFISRWLVLVLNSLPNTFILIQLLLSIAFVAAHHLAL